MEFAGQTVSAFLDMCKQGQVQEAIDKYRDATSAFSPQDIGFLQNIVDYSMRDVHSEAPPSSPPYIVVALDVTLSQRGSMGGPGPELRCSQDGSHILGAVVYLQ